jgi:class 3 adenylate cyclase
VALGALRALVRPDHPEPIAIDHWKRTERILLVMMPCLAALNVGSRFMFARDPGADMGAVDHFLAINLPAHAALYAVNGWALLRAGDDVRRHRAAAWVNVPLLLLTALAGMWLLGSVTPNLNTAFFVIIVAVVRVYFDSSLGLWALACAIGMHAGLILLEVAHVVRSQPMYRSGPLQQVYSSPATMLGAAVWVVAIYAVVWAMASYVANRFRASEHALRELNAGLETRVREQVDQLERAARLKRYVAPQLADQILRHEADLAMRRERRPVTVMFADLRGFTPMVERVDPEVLANVLNRYFDEVSRIAFEHGGTIDKFIGDAVMVFFGAPEATGERDQAVRCARMALAIQRRVSELGEEFVRLGAGAPLELRIGIGSGTATVGSFGAAHRSDYTVVGAPVNRAARLEPLAPPGGVLVDEQTNALVEGAIITEAHGEVALKGFAKTVNAYRLASVAVARAG